jgi:hypothetical protein
MMRMTASLADDSYLPLTGKITDIIMSDYFNLYTTHSHLLPFPFNYTTFASVPLQLLAVSHLLRLFLTLTIPPLLLDIFTTPFLLFSSTSFLANLWTAGGRGREESPWRGGTYASQCFSVLLIATLFNTHKALNCHTILRTTWNCLI